MATNVSIIGRSTKVSGRVSGAVDLDVRGFVDGEIAVAGDVTVDEHGLIGANVHARRLVVRGAIRGDLVGEESVVLEDGARVVGDVRAPRVTIAPGALVRGYVETGDAGAPAPRAARPQAAARPAPAPAAKAAPAPKPAEKAAAAASTATAHNGQPRRPPPPVVPALKKAKGQVARKRER